IAAASRPSHPKRTYHRGISGSYSTVWIHGSFATSPSRWAAIRSCRARRAFGSSGSSLTRAPDSVAAHEPARYEIAVETAKSPGGHAPRVARGSRGRADTHLVRQDLV